MEIIKGFTAVKNVPWVVSEILQASGERVQVNKRDAFVSAGFACYTLTHHRSCLRIQCSECSKVNVNRKYITLVACALLWVLHFNCNLRPQQPGFSLGDLINISVTGTFSGEAALTQSLPGAGSPVCWAASMFFVLVCADFQKLHSLERVFFWQIWLCFHPRRELSLKYWQDMKVKQFTCFTVVSDVIYQISGVWHHCCLRCLSPGLHCKLQVQQQLFWVLL